MPEELEDRYLVFKRKDIDKYLTCDDQLDLRGLSAAIDNGRILDHKSTIKCVVIEKDWPEYEPTVKALLGRINGNQTNNEVYNAFNADEIILLRSAMYYEAKNRHSFANEISQKTYRGRNDRKLSKKEVTDAHNKAEDADCLADKLLGIQTGKENGNERRN